MELFLVLAFAFAALFGFCRVFGRMEGAAMDTILKREWYWVVRHTWVKTDSGTILINERIDAAYVTLASEAVEEAKKRHPLKPNMALTAFACRNAADRYDARLAHGIVSKRITDFEHEMQTFEQRMH